MSAYDDFYEEDEPLEDVLAAFKAGEKHKTQPSTLTVDYRQVVFGWHATSPDTPDIGLRSSTLEGLRRKVRDEVRRLLGELIPLSERVHRIGRRAPAAPASVE